MRLLVTRPAREFEALAACLEAKGHEAIRTPMLEITPLEFNLPDPATCDGLVFSSANAVRVLADKGELKNYTGLPVFVVGAATADAARAAGFADIVSAAGDIGALGELLAQRCWQQGAKLVHFAGVERAGNLTTLIGAAGPEIETIEVYVAEAVPALPDQVGMYLRDGRIDGCILMSPRTAAIYSSLVLGADLLSQVRGLDHFCLSANVAQRLNSLGLEDGRIRIAQQPDLKSLLSLF